MRSPIKKHPNPITHRHNLRQNSESMARAYRALEIYHQTRDLRRVAEEMGIGPKYARHLINKAVARTHPIAAEVGEEREKDKERERLVEHRTLHQRQAIAGSMQSQALQSIADIRKGGKARKGELEAAYRRLVEADTILAKVADRRAKLQGLDAPSRTEVTGKDGERLLSDTLAEMLARIKAVLPEEWYDAVIRACALTEVGAAGVAQAGQPPVVQGEEGEGEGGGGS